MADSELHDIAEDTTPDPGDDLYLVDSTGTVDKRSSVADVVAAGLPSTVATDAEVDADVAAEAAARAAADTAHEADTTNVHGIADTALLETAAGAQAKADAAEAAAQAAVVAGATAAGDTLAELETRLAVIEGFDTLSAELPLTLTDLGNGTAELRARGVPRRLHTFDPGAGVANTADESTLLAATFDTAAGELAEGDGLRLVLWGTWRNGTGGPTTSTFRLKADGLSLGSVAINNATDGGVINRHWRYEVDIIIGATDTAPASTGLLTLRASIGTSNDESQQTHSASGNTLDLSQPITWDFTVDHAAASANLSAVLLGGYMEHVKV